jgi:hypothetical protein
MHYKGWDSPIPTSQFGSRKLADKVALGGRLGNVFSKQTWPGQEEGPTVNISREIREDISSIMQEQDVS